MKITEMRCHCKNKKCRHTWLRRTKHKPKMCPKCRSLRWDR